MRIAPRFAALLALLPASAPAQWPGGARAAVALTYDDALTSQLDHAVPALRRAGLKGTFFLSNVKRADVRRWRRLAREGGELANHTVFHACPAKTYPSDPRYVTEAYAPGAMVREIEQQNVLMTALDGRAEHGFGTPCGNTSTGGGDYRAALEAAGIVSYVRNGVATAADLRAGPAAIDPRRIPARDFPEGVTGAQLIAFAQAALAGGGLAVFVFHGVDGEYLNVSGEAHRELLAWLKAHRREIWTAPLRDIAALIAERRAASAPSARAVR